MRSALGRLKALLATAPSSAAISPAVTLAAKNDRGERQAYLASRKWVDGSISDDLPAKRLSRIYGVNHFIVSQVNPHVVPFVTDTRRDTAPLAIVKQATSRTAREWLNAGASLLEKPLSLSPTLNRITNAGLSIINQDYVGDVNILPDKLLFNPLKLLAHRSADEVLELITMGERATWPKIEMIRVQSKIGRTLDEIVNRFEHNPTSAANAPVRHAV